MGDEGSDLMVAGKQPKKLHVVLGTRPEAVKIAPLALAMAHDPEVEVVLVDTGQQPGRVAEALEAFGLSVDTTLDIERHSGSLAELAALVATAMEAHLDTSSPDAVLVQGDTSTAFVASLAAFWHRTPVIHLEAGLRTHDLEAPFPEEANRAMLARIAAVHLAPTPRAAGTLAAEGIPAADVIVTGNTVVDALGHLLGTSPVRETEPGLVAVTVHRREAWGRGVEAVCAAVRRTALRVPHSRFTVVAHPNPEVAAAVHAALDGLAQVEVVAPLPYPELLDLLGRSELVLTDSGGIQEEAPSLGLPALVARTTTERPEAVEAGSAVLVGLDTERIAGELERLLTDPAARKAMAAIENPFGDGHAARRCAEGIRWFFGLGPRPADWSGQPAR